MQNNVSILGLHSHSGLERDLRMPKHIVLIDEEFVELFFDCPKNKFKHGGKTYYKIPILSFVHKGGIFKNLNE